MMEPIKITAELKSYLIHYFLQVQSIAGPFTSTEIIEIPQPNWHLFYFSSSNFTVQDHILSSTGDALTEVNG